MVASCVTSKVRSVLPDIAQQIDVNEINVAGSEGNRKQVRARTN